MSKPNPQKLSRLLSPRSIAFVGGTIAEMAIVRSREMGYSGEIWPVHPTRSKIAGVPAYPTIKDLPGIPDAAFIGIRRELTIDAIGELSALGAGGCVCYAAGFAEMGDEGAALQHKLVTAAGDMPVIGPNCFGFINYLDRSVLWPYLHGGQPIDRGVALVSQSGNIAMNLTMNDRSVRFTHVIGAGNQAVLGPADYVNALLDDERVAAIGMYIEGFDDVHAFARAAERAREKKVPIVVMKVGRTEASSRQSKSHTSSLTGSDILYDAFFKRLGIVRVDSLNRLLETLKIFDRAAPLTGRDIVTLSCSGGEAATVADLAPQVDLSLPQFSKQQTEDLEAQFPNYVTVSNPFDYNTSIWGQGDALQQCFTASLNGAHDAAFLIYDHPSIESEEVDEWLQALDAFITAHKVTGMPAFVICTVSELLPIAIRDRALDAGVVPLQGLEDGLYAYAAAARYFESAANIRPLPDLPQRDTVAPATDVIVYDEAESKTMLAEFGLAVPTAGRADLTDAGDVADAVGYPCVLKALGKDFLHKTELGGVALNLASKDSVQHAAQQISTKTGTQEFLLERMVEDVVAELIVGIKRDEQFGPALVIGSGGILVELLQDSVSLLLPASREEVQGALLSLHASKLLAGFRGKPAGSLDAAVDAILAVAKFAAAHRDRLLELDVNPLLVTCDSAVAADALVILSD